MIVDIFSGKLEALESPVLVVGLCEPKLPESLKRLDAGGLIASVLKEFSCEFRQTRTVHLGGSVKNVLLVGLGRREDVTADVLRRASGFSAKVVRDGLRLSSFATLLWDVDVAIPVEERVRAVSEGVVLGGYQFNKFKTVEVAKIPVLSKVSVVCDSSLKKVVDRAVVVSDCQNLVRDLVNEPPSIMTPVALAREAQKVASKSVSVNVFDKAGIEKIGLTALLAVNRGSVNEPRFIVMEYNGGGSERIALVGKGITFDSGGLDLKPASAMETMKCDMSGAASVIGTISAISRLGLPVHVFGVIPATENMLGENAYKPSDVFKTYNGKTIEIGNTDAEGRVVLCDALCYAQRDLKATTIIDLATLTGAVVVALGSSCAGIMGNDDVLIRRLIESGSSCGERLWQLPLWKEHKELVKADLADVYNIGTKKEAGSIVGAAFLWEFIETAKWAHLDIAGTAFSVEDQDYCRKGGTGFGVRLLVEVLSKW